MDGIETILTAPDEQLIGLLENGTYLEPSEYEALMQELKKRGIEDGMDS